jgi:hypothetical protein
VGREAESAVSIEDSKMASIVISAVSFVPSVVVFAGPVFRPWHAS